GRRAAESSGAPFFLEGETPGEPCLFACRQGAPRYCPPDRGRSPSAACWPAEADCRKSVILYLAMRCEPGRFAVRRRQCRDTPMPARPEPKRLLSALFRGELLFPG